MTSARNIIMFACCASERSSGEADEAAESRNRKIEKRLRQDEKQMAKEVKVLLLG